MVVEVPAIALSSDRATGMAAWGSKRISRITAKRQAVPPARAQTTTALRRIDMNTIDRTRLLVEPASATPPLLSAILVARDGWHDLDKLLEHLRNQTIQAEIELLIVGDTLEKLAVSESRIRGFHSVRSLELAPLISVSSAHFSGVMFARAPLVVFCEDHCFPEPGWAAALVEAHEGPWAAVAPLMLNNNPARAVSRALMNVEYGIFRDPSQAGVRDFLPGHNSCYKKRALLDFSHRFTSLHDTEYLLHLEMRQAGWQLFQSAEARTAHTNISLFWPALICCFHAGRCFAAHRAADWTVGKKLVYALGSALLPFVRQQRYRRYLQRSVDGQQAPRIMPLTFLLFSANALGQIIGNLAGRGSSYASLCDLEFQRSRYVPPEEAGLFEVSDANERHHPHVQPPARFGSLPRCPG